MTTPANLSEQVVAAPSGAGAVHSLGETFTPDLQTGSGRYRIPLPLEPGPAGITPALALTYSSSGGSGVAGLGWELGLASIRRRTDRGIPTYDDVRDRFALQGDELIAQGGEYYRFRVEGRFARIRRLTGRGRDAWVVTERDGTRTFYGEVPEARLSAGAGRVAAWHVTRKQDVHGNEVVYSYERDPRTGEVRLVSVDWAGCYRVVVNWEPRPDPIVSARAGFPSRIENRVLSIELQVERGDTHVLHTYRRYDLIYTLSRWTGRSLLAQVVATGFGTDSAERALPALTFRYGDADLARARWHAVGGDRPGEALSARDVTLVRQSGSGLADLFETRPTGHFLRVNTGSGRFAAARPVRAPALVALSHPGTFLSDMDGDGYADLVVQGGRRVYTAAPRTGGWGGTYRAASGPSVDLDSPDVRLADLTGNGLPDAIRSGVGGWTFFENLGEGQWAPAVQVFGAPSLRLDDPRVHLADIDGDGLADLVYVDGGGVTVWPSFGRGRFGAGYRMAGAPRFGFDFDPKKVRFVELTGSRQADLLYVRDGVAHVAFNQAGVGLTAMVEVGRAPLTSKGFVEVTDFLGTGADGLLYTDQGGAWSFRELFTAGPLDLLSSIDNGIGGSTTITHGTSAAHWARDLAAGRPWRTSMPTVHRVVDRVTTTDAVTGTMLEVSLEYAHGVYDGQEREFRGFARVTQLDREAPATDPQPIAQARVVRWYHTGADLDLRNEWFPVPGALLHDEIPNHPWARRSVRGLVQREETYALDGQRHPYLVTETAYRTFAVGRSSASLHSAWAPLPVHSRSTVLERTSDVRQAEVLTTYDLHDGRTGGYGLPVEVREIGHGRLGTFSTGHEQQQTETLERFTRTTYVSLDQPEPDDPSAPYTPYYVVGKPSVQERFAATASGNALLAKTRSFYDGDDYEGLGYPGSGSLNVTKGLLSCRLELAFTSTGFTAAYPFGSGAASARNARGHYLVDRNEHYVHSVRMAYTENGLPSGSLDPNDNETTVEYDPIHALFPVLVTDPHSHPTVLEPGTVPFRLEAIVDPNGNRTEYTYDPTGLPASKAVMGKEVSGDWEGDPPTHPTEVHEYDFATIPIRITTKTRQVREGATFDVHRYVDGLSRTVQERHAAEPDPAASNTPRFRVTGVQVYNHKGLVVRAYQPTFATGSTYVAASTSVPSIETVYDPLGRPIRVNHPDGTYETTDYHPWVQTAWDRNDNGDGIRSSDPLYGPHLPDFRLHLNTPTQRYVDALGRVIAVVEDNGTEVHVTREVLDLKDQVTEVWDARDLSQATWAFTYDGIGRPVHTHHTTALGDRYALADASGNPIWARDARGVEVTRTFDILNRPLVEMTHNGADIKLRRQWRYVTTYDESTPEFANYQAKNLFGEVEEERDSDGLRFFEYERRGLVTRTSHRFWSLEDSGRRAWDDPDSELWTEGANCDPEIPAADRDSIPSYLALPDLTDATTLAIETIYDAAGRPTEVRYPEGMISRNTYNAAGLLEKVEVDRGTGTGYQVVVEALAYNARGQLTYVKHGNGVETTREYAEDLERLTRIFTRRVTAPTTHFQDLAYAYDPVGNPMQITDNLSSSVFSHNQIIPNTRTFGYDPRYRLIKATGKKHRTVRRKDTNVLVTSPDPNDYEPYTNMYDYDAVGNFTRNQEYTGGRLHYKSGRLDLFNGDEAEAGSFGDPGEGNFHYDANGSTTHTPRHEELAYTHDNQVRYVNLNGGGQVRYFRHGDQRVLRLVKKNGVKALSVHLGLFEYHLRKAATGYTKLVLHVEGYGRHAQAERSLIGSDPDSLELFFHHSDHLRSGHVLTKEDGDLLSQEEYFPHGGASDRRDARNRYRFIGVERDEDTELCMTGPRTYDPVCGRFLQGEPLAVPDESPYNYSSANPVAHLDRTGFQPSQPEPDPLDTQQLNSSKRLIGNNITVVGSEAFQNQAETDIRKIMETKVGQQLIDKIGKKAKMPIQISEVTAPFYNAILPSFMKWSEEDVLRLVRTDIDTKTSTIGSVTDKVVRIQYAQYNEVEFDSVRTRSFITLGHELSHARDLSVLSPAEAGQLTTEDPTTGIKLGELKAVKFENELRFSSSLPQREYYHARPIQPGMPRPAKGSFAPSH